MDLMGGYLLIVLVIFSANIALLAGNYKLNNLRAAAISLLMFFISFILIMVSNNLNIALADYFSYIFLSVSVLTFLLFYWSFKKNNFKILLYIIALIFIILVLLVSSQTNSDFLTCLLYSFLTFIIFFVVYQLTKLLHHAKRQYPVIIGEYMSLSSILLFILALTYESTRNLDYTMFSSFLILTPTYQLIYVIIGIAVVLVAGVLINDRGKN